MSLCRHDLCIRTAEVTIGLICACMPTLNRLYQSHKKPEEPIRPPPPRWALGLSTPKFLKRSRRRREAFSTALTTMDPRTTHADEEALVAYSSKCGSKSTPSSTLQSYNPPSATSKTRAIWKQHSSATRSLAPSSLFINSSHSSSQSHGATLSSISSMPSAQMKGRNPPQCQCGPIRRPTADSVPGQAASFEDIPSSPDWPIPRLPRILVARVSATSLEPSRILSPPPWHKRKDER